MNRWFWYRFKTSSNTLILNSGMRSEVLLLRSGLKGFRLSKDFLKWILWL